MPTRGMLVAGFTKETPPHAFEIGVMLVSRRVPKILAFVLSKTLSVMIGSSKFPFRFGICSLMIVLRTQQDKLTETVINTKRDVSVLVQIIRSPCLQVGE